VDTVVMQEAIIQQDTQIVFPTDIKAGINWRTRGEDIKQGDVVLLQGQMLRPQDIGLAVAAGYRTLTVYQPLQVALFSTGNELRDAGEALAADEIHDVNRHVLHGILSNWNCRVTDLGILADDRDTMQLALAQASREHHLIITSGGAATGSHDHVGALLAQQGQIHFWRLAIKPGRPLAFGRFDQALFLGLPGNPVAAAVCCLVFGGPLINAMAGGDWQLPPRYSQILGFDLHKRPGRREWVRVKRTTLSNGQVLLQKSASQGSGILTSMTQADGLVEVDEATTLLRSGSQVDFIPFSAMGLLER
jgi:molybdopterin molybdotransferase